MQPQNRLRIAVQKKGRLNNESMALFAQIGIRVQLSKNPKSRF